MKVRAGQSPARRPYRMVARAEAAEATGQNILEAAHQLFSVWPYDQVALRAVADRAGVTIQTVIRRFGSKEGLFTAVASLRSARIRSVRDQARAGDLEGATRNLIDSYEEWGDEQLHLLGQERRTQEIADAVNAGRRYHQAWVRRVFDPRLQNTPGREKERRLAQLVAVTDLYMWKILRRDLNLSIEETEWAMRDLVEKLIGP